MVPAISIIIPAHNEENYIRQVLHSIKNQTYQDYEVIVVTNGCTDNTEEVVKKRLTHKVKHFSMSQANVSRARNYGASKAEGNILLFLDADTTLEVEALQKIKNNFMEEHTVATTKSLIDGKNWKYSLSSGFKNINLTTGLYKGCSGALICRKEDFDKVNGYDPEIIVKEHRKLILNLLKQGKYSCIDTIVTNSPRRYEQWGISKITSFWVKQWFKDKFGNLKNSEYEKTR